MKLIDNARQVWHRLWSIRLLILTTGYTAAAGAWAVLPADLKPNLSEPVKLLLAGVGVLLPAIAAVAVVVRQDSLPPPKPTVPADRAA